jgi:hypothetical protein
VKSDAIAIAVAMDKKELKAGKNRGLLYMEFNFNKDNIDTA